MRMRIVITVMVRPLKQSIQGIGVINGLLKFAYAYIKYRVLPHIANARSTVQKKIYLSINVMGKMYELKNR